MFSVSLKLAAALVLAASVGIYASSSYDPSGVPQSCPCGQCEAGCDCCAGGPCTCEVCACDACDCVSANAGTETGS